MRHYRLTQPALEDLQQISLYLAQEASEAVASEMIERILDQLRLLARSPMIGRFRSEIVPPCRSLPVGQYVIYYRPIDIGIEVVRVMHGKRDYLYEFGMAD